jgi:glycerol-3-phosphate dehydrogenase (NAD(P)+)
VTKLAVIGTTSWGTTLAIVQARKGLDVSLWARKRRTADELDSHRQNNAMLPGIVFPDNLSVTHSLEETLTGATSVIFAVPSQTMRENAQRAAAYLDHNSVVVTASKGLELSSNLRMSEVLSQSLNVPLATICALSGPNLSGEVALGLPCASIVASRRSSLAQQCRNLLAGPSFFVQVSDDIMGIELCGALKNVVALGAGVVDGLGLGDNAKAIVLTQGWGEITALGVAMGARKSTFSGLAGLGDLFATCASSLSRNHYYGVQLAGGRSLADIMDSTPHVAEGIPTTRAAYQMAGQLGLDVPVIRLMYQLLFEGMSPSKTVEELLAITAGIARTVA